MRSEKFWEWYDSFAAPRLRGYPKSARDNTFRKMFEHLDAFDRPVNIIETGCIEDPENWAGNGCSTILFNAYVETHPGSTARSFEIVEDKVLLARRLCPFVDVTCGDSVQGLRKLAANSSFMVDLVYLDASHHSWLNEVPSQVHHFNELTAITPLLHDNSLVAVDDTIATVDDYPMNRVSGKGGMVAEHAMEIGAELQFLEYQVGFTKINKINYPSTANVEVLLLRAREYVEAGNGHAADRLYRMVLALTPEPWTGRIRIVRGEACRNFAYNAHRLRRHGLAIDWYLRALRADPLAPQYRVELARALVGIGSLDAARREAEVATEIAPNDPRTWSTLGSIASSAMDEEGCIAAYEAAVEAAEASGDPEEISFAYVNRSAMAIDEPDYHLARKLCRRIVELGVRPGDGYHHMAMMAYRESKHEDAIKLFDKALAAGCGNEPLTRWNKSLPLQAIGRLKEGFHEHSWGGEREEQITAIFVPHHRFGAPKWRGEPATTKDAETGRTRKTVIHVHTEAGYGDNISMWRYFPMLLERGYQVHYECDPSMIELVAANFPDVDVMPRAPDYPGVVGLKPFDFHIPIGDLHHAFGTDIDSIPWRGPYLKADPKLAAGYAKSLSLANLPGRKIGLCWSSGIRRDSNIWLEKFGKMKSMHMMDAAPLVWEFGNDTFVSLQVGDGRSDMLPSVLDLLPEKPSWSSTAALIDSLDLVICVDTGVAHLAGAMGKPCWVMCQRDGASWHFMCWRPGAAWNEASPWYPSIRVFRQHEFRKPGYWKDVIEDVGRALRDVGYQAA